MTSQQGNKILIFLHNNLALPFELLHSSPTFKTSKNVVKSEEKIAKTFLEMMSAILCINVIF